MANFESNKKYDEKHEPLINIENRNINITGFRTTESKFGDMAFVDVEGLGTYITGSETIIAQLNDNADTIRTEGLVCQVGKVKRYHTLLPPVEEN